jgi:hypothetical protein
MIATVCLFALAVPDVEAQRPAPKPPPGPTPRAGSWELSGGGSFVGGYDLGTLAAQLTRNTTTGSDSFDQFTTDSRIDSAFGVNGRIGYYFTPRLTVEGGFRFARPVYSVEISGDTEGGADERAKETIDQYLFTGSAVWHLGRGPIARQRAVPFVFGGAGYLRELHEGQELVETGTEYHAGAGLKYWFGSARRRFGLRGEAGVSFRDGGVDTEEKVRVVPIAGVSLVYLF